MVRRLVLALTVVAVVTGALMGLPSLTVGNFQVGGGIKAAAAQPGAPDYCGPYDIVLRIFWRIMVCLGVERVP